ncbi:Multidrug resistance protein MdtA precursor [Pseudovibrio axinellae]|uniref:Multidrug resistance protein MdtA n=1 Tax=Pseudovibrio axinellae TaxID=989403 RepID=A0A166AC47_9HYPH|nr:efflux RND transporter periplasmic adaptor subunit [Pseudovibrio axinellae]KZL20854.1 Multidrug resistance protein MdtA precursor [Pseudovibrio axinellae]SER20638.1 RND family efflux transporter, MFP subunit [Pseudovibrio axinellae]
MKLRKPTILRSGAVFLFLGILGAGTLTMHHLSGSKSQASDFAQKLIPVQSDFIKLSGGYQIEDEFVGRLEPAQQSNVAFEQNGLVLSMEADEGDRVQKGDIIARLDTQILEAERTRLEGQLQQVSSQLRLSVLTEKRQIILRDKGHVTQQKADEASLNRAALEGQKAAVVAALKSNEISLKKSVLYAPFNGTVGQRYLDTGSVISAGTPVVNLLETDKPQVRLGISPEAVKGLKTGQSVEFYADSQTLQGSILAIRPDISQQTRTVSILAQIENKKDGRFGDTVRLKLPRHIAASGSWVPISALSEGEKGLWVVLTLAPQEEGQSYRVTKDAVEVLYTDGKSAYVRGALSEGQRYISSGRNRIIPGQQVTLAKAS